MNIPKYQNQFRKDLEFKKYSENSIKSYESQVLKFLQHFEEEYSEPSKIPTAKIKEWISEIDTVNSVKQRISALKLFYKFTVGQPMKFSKIEFPRKQHKLPEVLSVEEVQSMFDVCENLKHKVILSLLYSTGMRSSELINLKWSDINRKRGVIHIKDAKGNKDRIVMLSEEIIPMLESYYREYRTERFILKGQFADKYSKTSLLRVVKSLAEKAGIKKRVWVHQMRHNCFTHMVESGVDINLIQKLAGHKKSSTTMIYTQISDSIVRNIQSPIRQISFS